MNIGIIGSGNIGSELARKLRRLGHKVRISNSRGAVSLVKFAEETGAIASGTEEVIDNSDVIIVSVPYGAIEALAAIFRKRNLADHVVVIDTGSYFHLRDGDIKVLDDEALSDSEYVSQMFAHPVVKVFNNIGVQSLAEKSRPAGHPDRVALPVAGDREDHKKVVMDLVESIGFDALDAGPLAQSWKQQPGTPAFCTDYDLVKLPSVLNRAVRPEMRMRLDVFISRVYKRDPAMTLEQTVEWCREENDQPIEKVKEAYGWLSEK